MIIFIKFSLITHVQERMEEYMNGAGIDYDLEGDLDFLNSEFQLVISNFYVPFLGS